MSKTAFIFPGQGAQYIGMGKDFYEKIPVAKEVFLTAKKASGLDVAALCFEENDKINITEYTQITMLTMEVAILRTIEEMGYRAQMAGGLSLGEYGAIAATHAMKDEDLFQVIRQRGIYMQDAVPRGGAMMAVLGLDTKVIEEICEKVDGMVTVANYNCPGQTVITGEEKAVALAGEKLLEAGARRCLPLKVSGPFHSPMLKEAGKRLGQVLEDVEVFTPQIPYVANVTADYVTDAAQIKPLLTTQVSASVRWQQSIERMMEDGVDQFIEIGPGKTLTGFMKKINPEVKVMNVEKVEDLEKLKEFLC